MTPDSSPVLRAYQASDRDALIALWSECDLLRPWNDPGRDIERKLAHDPEGLFVLERDGSLVGAVMVGYEGHRGWVNYLAVASQCQGRGFGRLLMAEAEQWLATMGCPKVNLQVRTDNPKAVGFYERIGYAVDDTVSMGKRLVDDTRRSR